MSMKSEKSKTKNEPHQLFKMKFSERNEQHQEVVGTKVRVQVCTCRFVLPRNI